jgi:hypothetical protein
VIARPCPSTPARRVIQRTEESLLSGDLVLLKETPRSLGRACVRAPVCRRVGVLILPFADDAKAWRGSCGVDEEEKVGGSVGP